MNYLVTGATGFIGRRLVETMLSQGDSVYYLARKRPSSMDSRAAFFHWNPSERPALDGIPSVDAVIHLAGEPVAQRWNDRVKRRLWESRVTATHDLVEAISKLRKKPSVVVSASAIGYYGDRGSEMLTEASSPAKDFLAQLCVHWEAEALRAQEAGIRVVPIRLGIVLGPHGGALQAMLPMFKAGLGGKISSGDQWMPWIHRDDAVNLLRFAATRDDVSGPMNATSPNPVQNRDFTKVLADILHRPALIPVPFFALRILLGEVAGHVVASSRVLPEKALQAGFRFAHPTVQEALFSILAAAPESRVSAAPVS